MAEKNAHPGIVFKFRQNAPTIQELLDKIQELPNLEALSEALYKKLDKEYSTIGGYTPYDGESPIEWLPYYILDDAGIPKIMAKNQDVYGDMMSEPIFLTEGSIIRIVPQVDEDLSDIRWNLNFLSTICTLGDEVLLSHVGGGIYSVEGSEYIVENRGWYTLAKPDTPESDIYSNHSVEIIKNMDSNQILSIVIEELLGYKDLIQLPIVGVKLPNETLEYISIGLSSKNYPNGFMIINIPKASTTTSGCMSYADKSRLDNLPNRSEVPVKISNVEGVIWFYNKDDQGLWCIPLATNSVSGLMSPSDIVTLHTTLPGEIQDIKDKIPAGASKQDPLATHSFVNSSVATNTANYISDNGQPFTSLADLEAYSGELTNNDYAFIVGTDAAGNTIYTRYKYNATTETWAEEYVLNNSSLTAAQWDTLNSGITALLVQKLLDLPDATQIITLLGGKVDKVSGKSLSTNDYTNNDKTKVGNLTFRSVISDSYIPCDWCGTYSNGGHQYDHDTGARITITEAFRVDRAIAYNARTFVVLPSNNSEETITGQMVISNPGRKIKSLRLVSKAFTNSYHFNLQFEGDQTVVTIDANANYPMYKYFETPVDSVTINISSPATEGVLDYKGLCFLRFEVESV